ncbi:MAG: TonB-dependent receptor [Ferruginibacter sp.]|nr:TonB-dependent receptor [Ferruginibacter sp.]
MKNIFVIFLLAINLVTFAQKKNIKQETFKVFGTCEQCKTRIESTLKDLGTYKANWVIETNMLTVSFDSIKLTKAKISKKLATVGHDTELFLSTKKTYNNLPACCHYQRLDTAINYIKPIDTAVKKNEFVLPTLIGFVFGEDTDTTTIALQLATVINVINNKIVVTDSAGGFAMNAPYPAILIVSSVGYKTDTINVFKAENVKIILKKNVSKNLKEVIIETRKPSAHILQNSTLNTINIGTKELAKAACCNLSESFETSPSIDVSFADAVTGIKQIQLLGLSGNYVQLTTENTPEIKGLIGNYGLTFIPGPWVESIQVTKGTGSVANGYESIAGQINVEEKKPDKMDRFFINGYANNMGRVETTINFAQKINSNWSTALLTHANAVGTKNDANKDGFLDLPTGKQLNFVNRWRYANTNGIIAQFAIKALNDKRIAGERDFNLSADKLTTNKYGVGINVQQYAVTSKLGYVFPNKIYKSIGVIVAANKFNNNSFYGLKIYDANQKSLSLNVFYQSIINTTVHKFRTGLNLTNETYFEKFTNNNYFRKENFVGSFVEYTYTPSKKITGIFGLRVDYHNQYGFITTPRLHIKYDINSKTNLRFSVGSGFKTASILAENTGFFASSRNVEITNATTNYGYGLMPEKAWNFGANFLHNFRFNNRTGSISVDLYRTVFKNQTVVDVDANPQKITFYNLSGKSFSNSLQAEINYEIIKKLEVRLAYRWLDVQTNYGGSMLPKPFTAKHRAFINLAYETNNKWKFDATTQWLSKKRLPNTSNNPSGKQMENYSPSFLQISGQVSKQINTKFELYLGVENATNFTQKNLFIDVRNPFSTYFDGSMIWGPVNGRTIYLGFRFKIN